MAEVNVDLGGTWLRISSDAGRVVLLAPSGLHHPGTSAGELIDLLVEQLAEHVPFGASVAMSVGAAMDETDQVVHGSGPLWGGGLAEPVRLRDLLVARRPDVSWFLVNDLTAGLADFAGRYGTPGVRRVAYLSVGSGIALRTADLRTGTIAVDSQGLQGEVGHLRAVSDLPLGELRCPCGGLGHVSAVSAGPAIGEVARVLGIEWDVVDEFSARLTEDYPDARALLTVIVGPVAELIRAAWAFDPWLDLVGVGGGVAENLRPFYGDELARQVSEVRSYADRVPVADRLRVLGPDEIDVLAGARRMAEGALRVTKNEEVLQW
ncbi:MAG TPA: hypothetical protein VF821_29170 [Lentzea sp.]